MTLINMDCSIVGSGVRRSRRRHKIVKKQAFTCRSNLVQISLGDVVADLFLIAGRMAKMPVMVLVSFGHPLRGG